jgi:hypothetical protein
MDINNKEYIEDLTSIRTAFSSILSELKTSEVRKKIELNIAELTFAIKISEIESEVDDEELSNEGVQDSLINDISSCSGEI